MLDGLSGAYSMLIGILTACCAVQFITIVVSMLVSTSAGGISQLWRAMSNIFFFTCVVVLLLSIVQNTPLPMPDLSRYEGAVQQQVEDAQAKNRTILLEQTQAQLELWLAQQAAGLQLNCSFTVTCDADTNGNVTVRWVEGIYRGGPRENLVSLREMIRTQLSVTDGQILIREETS